MQAFDSVVYRGSDGIGPDKSLRDGEYADRAIPANLDLLNSGTYRGSSSIWPDKKLSDGVYVNSPNSPTRSSPQIGNLGMAGASVLSILIIRYLWKQFYKKKEPEIKQEPRLSPKEIDKKLASIFDENIIFNEQESTIKFNNFSAELCKKMAKFFIDEELSDNVSDDTSKGLTLKKLNLLTADKFNQVFDKFIIQFKNELDQEKQQIAQKKQAEEDSRKQQEDIKELRVFVNNAIAEVREIKAVEDDKSRSGRPIERKKEEEIKAKQKYEKEQEIISKKVRAMENYTKDVKKFESILSQEQIDFFNKKFKDLTSNKILFEAVRKNEVNVSAQKKVIEIQGLAQQEQVLQAQDNEPIKIPAPASASASALIQNLSMPDLVKLKALFLEEGYTKIYYPEARDNSLEFEKLRLGFLHHEALEGESFKSEYSSQDNIKSYREFGGINPNDENLAKHYFHSFLDGTVEEIYQRSAGKSDLIDEEKQSIKDNLYSFLNYAMGDWDSVLKDYKKREIEGRSRGGLTGLGHASGAKLEDSEKLCLCLKMFKDGGKLSAVNKQQLEEFTEFKAFAPKFQTENTPYRSIEIQIQENSDDIFAQNLISELSNQSKKLAGQERLENVVKEFFSSNAQKILEKLPENCGDYSQKISQVTVTTDCDGNIFQYLAKNPEIIKDIIDFANGKDLSFPSRDRTIIIKNDEEKSSLKDELKSVCERLKLEIGEMESSRGRAL